MHLIKVKSHINNSSTLCIRSVPRGLSFDCCSILVQRDIVVAIKCLSLMLIQKATSRLKIYHTACFQQMTM